MISEQIAIRETVPADLDTIVQVHKSGFGYDKEAELTAALLGDPTARPFVSLLAFHNGEAVGHILFTRSRIEGAGPEQPATHILAPLAVIPACQKQGVGGLLIAKGLELLRQRGTALVFVLGHLEYYPRHGFIPDAGKLGYPAPYPILEKYADYWMVQALSDDAFAIVPKGRVVCADALDRPEHWRE
ncbi:N-acetyltransferase [uncultured Alistipes sp.]|jgi:acetyltransferase|uniref:GNAT family N-acetyltransferase n=1 Tax=uncultured Alistipes sp. TaxID=538949 RepID=UPI0025EDDBBD|nr:N-acetyltransferase [uncultured Alistipes sp.]